MHAEYLTNIVRRGEPVSDHYAGTANEAGRVYVEHLDSFKADLEQYIDDLKVIRDKYAQQEEEIGDGFHGTGT
ncbi:MAG: hypothetical protein ACRDQ7_00645 [Haloechinothrix sp.]